jgi:hypothetical protein
MSITLPPVPPAVPEALRPVITGRLDDPTYFLIRVSAGGDA